jgi:hypothetical protein
MSDWQPIETAPKDGTFVMLWVGGDYPAHCARFEIWKDGSAGWVASNHGGVWTCVQFGTATHWMPLPAPPVTT